MIVLSQPGHSSVECPPVPRSAQVALPSPIPECTTALLERVARQLARRIPACAAGLGVCSRSTTGATVSNQALQPTLHVGSPFALNPKCLMTTLFLCTQVDYQFLKTPLGNPNQLAVYQDCIDRHRNDHKWMGECSPKRRHRQ